MRLDLTDTPALTLQNPWPYAITHLGKRVENRSWPAPAHVDRLLIHSGKGWDLHAPAGLREEAARYPERTSAIVAVARLAYCCDSSVDSDRVVCGCGKWAMPGQYHWRLTDDVLVLTEPVPCSGALKLWKPKPDVLRDVEEAITS